MAYAGTENGLFPPSSVAALAAAAPPRESSAADPPRAAADASMAFPRAFPAAAPRPVSASRCSRWDLSRSRSTLGNSDARLAKRGVEAVHAPATAHQRRRAAPMPPKHAPKNEPPVVVSNTNAVVSVEHSVVSVQYSRLIAEVVPEPIHQPVP